MICLLPGCGHAGQAGRFRLVVSFTEDFWHCRQTGVASTPRAPGPVPVTPTEAATTATATTASASQAQTVCMPLTQCPPVTSAFVPLSAGGYSLPSTSSTPRTSTLQHHSGQAVLSSRLSRSPYAYPLPSYTWMYGAIPYFRASDYPLTHPSSSRGLSRARLQPSASYPSPCPSTNHRPTTVQLRRRRCSLKMSATRSRRRDRPTIPSSIYLLFVAFVCLERG